MRLFHPITQQLEDPCFQTQFLPCVTDPFRSVYLLVEKVPVILADFLLPFSYRKLGIMHVVFVFFLFFFLN